MTDKLTKAKTQVILHHPFLASIILRHPITLSNRVPTMGIDRAGAIFINPEFIEPLSVQQIVFGLWHEAFHRLKMSHLRQDWRDARLWNIAEDAVINETLIADQIGEFISGGVRYPGAEKLSGERVYEELLNQQNGKGMPGQSVPGPGEDWGIGADMLDEGQPMTEGQKRAMVEEIRQEIAAAAQAAKAQGKMPGGIGRLVDEILNPKVSYKEILERWMVQKAKNDYSWAKANRRFVAQGIYMPSLDGVGMGEIAVIIDTSGSVSATELKHFWGSIRQIFEEVRPTVVHIVNVDSEVSGVHTLTEMPAKPLANEGGGGTDMRVGVRYVERELSQVDCMVLLTDGETPWPQSRPEIPLIVVTTTDYTPPRHVAESVRMEV